MITIRSSPFGKWSLTVPFDVFWVANPFCIPHPGSQLVQWNSSRQSRPTISSADMPNMRSADVLIPVITWSAPYSTSASES